MLYIEVEPQDEFIDYVKTEIDGVHYSMGLVEWCGSAGYVAYGYNSERLKNGDYYHFTDKSMAYNAIIRKWKMEFGE